MAQPPQAPVADGAADDDVVDWPDSRPPLILICQDCGERFSEAQPHSHVTPTAQRCAPCCARYGAMPRGWL